MGARASSPLRSGLSQTPPNLTQRFIMTPSSDFPTAIEALLSLEKDNSSLQVSMKINQKGDFILQAKNAETYILVNITTLTTGKSVNLLTYTPPLNKTKMVLEGYPHGFPMDRLEGQSLIESVEVPTNQRRYQTRFGHCIRGTH